MRLIDADRLKRQVAGRSYKAKMKFIELIDNSPTVEPVKHGRWQWNGNEYFCTVCGHHAYGNGVEIITEIWHYCPSCGAKMEPISASPENGQEVEA